MKRKKKSASRRRGEILSVDTYSLMGDPGVHRRSHIRGLNCYGVPGVPHANGRLDTTAGHVYQLGVQIDGALLDRIGKPMKRTRTKHETSE
jgi:hypothetical protein